MATFAITIDDPAHIFGLAAAVARKNEGLSKDDTPFTDVTYVQFIVEKACASYAQDFPMPTKATYEAAISALEVAKLSANSEDANKIEKIRAELTSVKDGKLSEIAAVAIEAEAIKG